MPWSNARPSSAEYGAAWARTRKQWAARHQPWHTCTRCGHTLGPMGPHLHLDHDDHDRTIVLGFAHARCNLRAGARAGRAKQNVTQLRW